MSGAKEFVGPLLGRDRVQSYAKYLLRSGRIKKVYLPFIEEVLGRIGHMPEKILDLGTGPGFLAMEFAKELPYSQVVGLDLSNDMLAYAKREAKKEGLKNISFFLGDAQEMPFEDEFFDLVVSHGLIKCIPDKVKAFKEVCRVLKTGGFAFLIDVRKEALRELEKIASRISLEEYTKRKRATEKGLTSDEVKELLLKSNLKKRANLEKKAFKFQIVIHK